MPVPSLPTDVLTAISEAEASAAAAVAALDASEEVASSRGSLYDRAATDGELLDEGVATLIRYP